MTSQTTSQTQTTNRLNLWDFDDTLAFSGSAVEVLKSTRPDVEGWRWWHEPELSISAVMVTDAIEGMWKELVATPGEHWICTGRCGEAVLAWLDLNRGKVEGLELVTRVISTSDKKTAHLDTAVKKAVFIQQEVQSGREVHLYDDRMMNLEHAQAVGAVVHLVQDGRLV